VARVGRSRALVLLLLITTLLAVGQYVVIAFAGPLLIRLTDATPEKIAAIFAVFGVMTLVGNLCASRVVQRWRAFTTSAVFMACVVFVTAMQQVRSIMTAPPLATASVAINNTALYLG
jgi:predicted MFS family arabinose efflux permease